MALVDIPVSTPFVQNFDGIGTTATATLPTDFKADRQPAARTVGNYANAGTATTLVGGANLSSTASNGIYNFGSGTTTTGSDRAIGFLSSGSGTQSGNLYAKLTNNTNSNLDGVEISYDIEKYRNGSNANGFRIQLYYSTDGANWIPAGNDFLTSFPQDAANTGFSPAPGETVNITNKNLNIAVPAQADFYLAWNYSVTSLTTTTNAQALAIDNISIKGIESTTPTLTNPSGTGSANPNPVLAGSSTLLTVSVTPGTNPLSSGLTVTGDLSSIGGASAQVFIDNGNNSFVFQATVASNTTAGAKAIPVTISDAQNRSGSTTITLTVEEPAPPVNHMVISQIYGGGGNSGSTYRNDYIELYNPGTVPFDLGGWTVQYAAATGTTWQAQPLGGVIQPGEYYLVSLASGGTNGSLLPTEPNVSGSINMSGTTGKVALVSNGDPLEGGCPLADSTLIDFVGYGTTANCREGATNAPPPSNTIAIFRKNGGLTDTNVNGADFVTGAPNPRRTTPIVEIGPYVLNTDPRSNALTAPRDASINVTFTEAVDVEGGWFNINCVNSGAHNDATVASSSGSRNWIITPNVNFQPEEQCIVTIFKNFVHDQDLDDSAPNTDTLTADKSFTFTVSTGTAPPYSPDVHLLMGNPTNATADFNLPNNYLMEKPEFALSYSRDRGTPNWVSWHLSDEWVGTLSRVDTFRPDPAVPSDWYRVLHTDYSFTGFDRGHMVPNADRDKETSVPINQATFLMTNMIPQSPDNNQGPWANLENYLRTLLPTNEIYIVAGGAGTGGTGSNGFTQTIAGGKVTVPASTWKVALIIPKGENDLSRVSASTRTLAVIMPNTQGIRTSDPNDWQNYLTTIDAVEQLTGYDFFSNVPDDVEYSIEAGTDGNNPPGVADRNEATQEDTALPITLTAVNDVNNPLTFVVVSPPANGTLAGTGANLTYTPNANFYGSDSFTYKAIDGAEQSNTATVSIFVSEVNDAPEISPIADQFVFLGNTLNFTATASDADLPADTLTFSLGGNVPAGAAINGTTGEFSWTPTAAQAGQIYNLTVRVKDGSELFDETNVKIAVGYEWSGFLSPLNGPDNIFRAGQSVPVVFQLTGGSSNVMDAAARLYLAPVTGNTIGAEVPASSSSSAVPDNRFRYSDGKYIFNLNTRNLSPGTYRLRIELGDGILRTIFITLK